MIASCITDIFRPQPIETGGQRQYCEPGHSITPLIICLLPNDEHNILKTD